MPELFAIFLLGSILSLITGLIMLFLQLAKYRSDRFLMVQKNLQKIDLRWNDLEGGTEPVAARSTENEIARARTTYILCCLFAMMFSWAGFFVLLLIWVSIKKLIVNKLEKQLFTSELALLELDRAQVFQKVQSLQKAFKKPDCITFDSSGFKYKAISIMKIILLYLSASSIVLSIVLSLVGCSSYFKRKTCESTNWFEYGQNVALEGRRLTGDQFISECNNAEADVAESALDRGFKSGLEKYCQPEMVFQTGKAGNFFSTEMCTGQGLNVLTARHRAGVQEYCQKSNAYSSGARGKAYNKICPADLEVAFLPEFNRGRKRFLESNIAENEKLVHRLDHEISSLQNELRFKASELQRYQYMVAGNKDEKFMQRLNELNRERQNLETSIRSKESEQSQLLNKNREYKLEMIKLE